MGKQGHRRGLPTLLATMATQVACAVLACVVCGSELSGAETPLPRIDARYAEAGGEAAADIPDFRRHVVPLMGRLGCNGRACHGSFQGQGGFQLSLFGYDFKADHENLVGGDEPRINVASPRESLALLKPLEEEPHDGGKRLDDDTWQLRVLEQWIHGGAEGVADDDAAFVRLEVEPKELVAATVGEQWNLRAIAVWSDGSREDVTPLCRFQSNNDQIAVIDEHGLVTAAGPGDTHVVAFYDNGVVPVPVLFPVSDQVGPNYPDVPTPTPIDELVVAKLRKLGEVPSDLCTDGEFLRRISLDLTGTLPSQAEAEAFLADTSPDKRATKIDELLERPGYAAWWATRFCDWTGNNAQENQQNGPDRRNTASVLWYEWMRARVTENTPYDEIVERIVLSKSREDNESYEDYCERMSGYLVRGHQADFAEQTTMPYYWSRRNFRTTEERALGFAYAFLGVRIQCAQCHKHPFDQWTKDDFDRFENFFARVRYQQFRQLADSDEASDMMEALELSPKLRGNQLDQQLTRLASRGETVPFGETVVLPPPKPMSDEAIAKLRERATSPERQARLEQMLSGRTATVLGGDELALDEVDDPREVLMAWMRDEDNPYFARAIVNRVWASYFNVGIVEPPDDLSLANPPSNEPLLDHLAAEFREHGYDLKWLHREICSSRTYQLSWQPNATNAGDDRNFARAVARRIPAEVIYDAIKIATAGAEESQALCSLDGERAIDDAVVDSRRGSYALSVFGRSLRESNCDCDRSMEPSLLQTVFLQNDGEMLAMISRPEGWVAEATNAASTTPTADADAPPRERFWNMTAAEVAEMIEKGKVRLARAKREGDEAFLVKGRRFLAAMERRLEQLEAGEAMPAGSPQKKTASDEQQLDDAAIAELVRSAYLRTLTRLPEPGELERAREYFADVSAREAARDLMWALLNTKEFQLNH